MSHILQNRPSSHKCSLWVNFGQAQNVSLALCGLVWFGLVSPQSQQAVLECCLLPSFRNNGFEFGTVFSL